VKFIFIFFFKASYDPQVIFELTPLYLLSGFSNVQLLSLSLLVTSLDMILHLQASKRNLLVSFLPTALLLTSIGFTIMFNPMGQTYLFHYLLFGCLLLIVLIDYHYVLKGVDAPKFFKRTAREVLQEPLRAPPPTPQPPPFFAKKPSPVPSPPNQYSQENVADLKRFSDAMVQKMQHLVDDLEKKSQHIEALEQKIQQQQPLPTSEKLLSAVTRTPAEEKIPIPAQEKQQRAALSDEEKIILKERIENHLVIDEMEKIVAVIQRGIFRDISNSFAGFLGYQRTELLQKNFFVFISPSGFDDARKYYLNRLKGVATNSFKTVLLTKTHTEIPVEISVSPTVFKGESAEFISIKERKDQDPPEN
jgi:PAS domain S-box-containing protein